MAHHFTSIAEDAWRKSVHWRTLFSGHSRNWLFSNRAAQPQENVRRDSDFKYDEKSVMKAVVNNSLRFLLLLPYRPTLFPPDFV